VYEETPRFAGSVRLMVAPSNDSRTYLVEHAADCTLVLADGQRRSECRGTLPPHLSAELLVDFDAGAFRALLFSGAKEQSARLALELPIMPGPTLGESVAVPLQAGRTDRTVVLDRDAVVHFTAETGVCGVYRGNDLLVVDGLDKGCDIVRVFAKGTYRFLIRPFAGLPMNGSVRWQAEPVVALNEGVGPEVWLAPGAVRLFRFSTQAKGKIGLGLQSNSERLECAVLDDGNRQLGQGCHQYLSLEKGSYLLTVRNPSGVAATPLALKPVVLGLAGDAATVPTEYLEEFFRRIAP
jgi:hypothetical protein